MIDLKQLQDRVWANKEAKGFNTTDVNKEFAYTYAELAEAFESYRKNKGDVGEELADVMIYLLALAKMLGVKDFEADIMQKIETNEKRTYQKVGDHNVRIEGESNV